MDAEEFRDASRDRWERVAAGWGTRREEFQRGASAVSMWMIDALAPQPGQTLLELAAGPGDTGLLAAELLRPGGKLISTDGADAMVALAQQRAEELGLQDVVEARQMEAEWIDLPTASVDGVLCRWGYMLLADPEAALRETRRVLRPEGRVALAAWAGREHNPLMAAGGSIGVQLGLAQAPPEGTPGPFALSDPAELSELLSVAGFAEVQVDSVEFTSEFESLDAAWEFQRDLSPTLQDLLPGLTPAQHYQLRDAFDAALTGFTAADGRLTLPSRTLVAAASA